MMNKNENLIIGETIYPTGVKLLTSFEDDRISGQFQKSKFEFDRMNEYGL